MEKMRISAWVRRGLAALVLAAVLVVPSAAHAFWRGGVFFGFPLVYAPPLYYPPPFYYPPPIYYPPPVTYQSAPLPPRVPGQSCYAGSYVCPLAKSAPVGGSCSCPANGGGRVSGHVG